MRKILIYTTIFILFLSILAILTYKEEKKFDKYADIKILNNPCNIGEITLNDTINHKFILKNVSNNLFVINKVFPSCTCTNVNYSKNKANLNETIEVNVKYIPKIEQIGNIKVVVFLECNANKGIVKLELLGKLKK